MVLLKINNVDFTDNVIHQKGYSVLSQDIYTRWTDGNHIEHREVSRQRVSGSFNMVFRSEAEFNTFIEAIAAVKTSGYCPIQVWVNTTKTLTSIQAFVDIKPVHRWTEPAFGQTPELATVSVKIQER